MIQVDPSNAGQFTAWDGEDGAYWAARADRFDEGVAAYVDLFFQAAALRPGDDVLDIGCGSGQMTREAARRQSIRLGLGVDLSARQIEVAKRLALSQGLPNVRFLQADAQVHRFPREGFDVAISRHGAMFFGDPVAAFANVRLALRPGGRLVLLTWQPPRYNADDACHFICGQFAWMLDTMDEQSRIRAVDTLRAGMAAHVTENGVVYDSSAWLIRATVASSSILSGVPR